MNCHTENKNYSPGLEGIIAGVSAVSEINPGTEHLSYRGYDIHDLVERSNYEETAYLLLYGKLPSCSELTEFSNQLHQNRYLDSDFTNFLKKIPVDAHPMDTLRFGISYLSLIDPDKNDMSHDANIRKAIRILAKASTIIAASYRISQGMEPVEPRDDLSRPHNFLYMINGEVPDDFSAKVFDKSVILYAEHGFNASTFCARVTCSTLSDMYSAIIAAIGTLKGPLHGGANEKAMDMLIEIGDPQKAQDWVHDALQNKKRIMGFGHREYKKGDPRARILKPLFKELSERLGNMKWYEISEIVEDIIVKEKKLPPNVDFPSGPIYHLLGLPPKLYTPIFALARFAGWSAHVIEQLENNRLIRPECIYNGERNLKYVPIDKR
ncbi:MAG: citrate/2-methylcitrate synthase [Chlamydiota bacterium]|nr:citrate/2-methylcitrate synthase [Chlamydiota bacterium]